MQDADRLTLGMWVDYIIDCNNMERKAQMVAMAENGDDDGFVTRRRKATQADFDRF